MKLKRQQGVALIVTLIMLSLITFLAVAFLAVTQRERQNVTTSQSTFNSKVFSDAGLARAEAEIVSRMMALSNTLSYDLMVSRNQDIAAPALLPDSLTNLYHDARPPVFVRTNTSFAQPPDERFYVDFNRNGRFESNGFAQILLQDAAPLTNTSFFIGDPEWIGILQNPDLPYSSSNRFIGRYAYIAVPVGKTYDLNTVHNYNKGLSGMSPAMPLDGYMRDQGAGPWEINLAGFFSEWNTNLIPPIPLSYQFSTNAAVANTGLAFDYAVDVLRRRYAAKFNLQPSLKDSLGPLASAFYSSDLNDIYGAPISPLPFGYGIDPDNTIKPWAGSGSTNAFADVQELFQTALSNRLDNLRARSVNDLTNSYDRYSFYRLIGQLGTESVPELEGKINLHFTNDPALNIASTNFVTWTPLGFFTNAADRLLRTYYGLSVTNIPVFNPTNVNIRYSAGLHRVLQVAANIYEATRTNAIPGQPIVPKVFRPILMRDASKDEVYINGFVEITNITSIDPPAFSFGRGVGANGIPIVNPGSPFPIVDLSSAPERTEINNLTYAYGIPLVIGARKGLPNFNEVLVKTGVTAERKLQLSKLNPPSVTGMTTNQMFLLTITNFVGVEAWNSYTNRFSNQVDMVGFVSTSVTLTNNFGYITNSTRTFPIRAQSNFWDGLAFSIPVSTNFAALQTSIYDFGARRFISGTNKVFYNTLVTPQWGLSVTNKIKFAIFQRNGAKSNLVDFVMLQGLSFQTNLTAAFYGGDDNVVPRQNGMWITNAVAGGGVATQGEINQLKASLGQITVDWRREPNKFNEISNFVAFTTGSNNIPDRTMQAPYTPAVSFIITASYGVNDPLVHYTDDDLYDPASPLKVEYPGVSAVIDFDIKNSNLGRLNTRYDPWGGNRMPGQTPSRAQTTPTALVAIGLKDSLVRWSDDWQFPTNFLPNIGWLGKIHRGTPWQTIYFKSTVADNKAPNFAWRQWSGSLETHPTNDWQLPDIFTVAASENAAKGLLSVNQTNTASWAALLAGLLIKTNVATNTTIIQPYTPQLTAILADIYKTRTNEPGGIFNNMGRILSVPALTVQSPYLTNAFNGAFLPPDDSTVESIPQQVLSLLQLGKPRVMIYAYGQSLAPAPNSILTELGFKNQLCTNYTVTGEVLTKTLLRIDGDYKKPKAVIESYSVVPQN